MKDVTPAGMSKAEAEEITERIRTAVEDIRKLVAKAHEGKAWKALGHKSWEAYVKAEFGMSRGHSYRLLQQGEVIEAIEEAVGDLSPMGDISERTARELKEDLPAAAAEVRQRVEKGEKPEDAAKDVAAQKRAEKDAAKAEREAQKAENERQRQEARQQFRPEVQASIEAREARKQQPAIDEPSPEDQIAQLKAENEELREANQSYEAEISALKAEIKKFGGMRVQYEAGGFEKVVVDMGEQIRVLRRQVEAESQEKVKNLRSMDFWRKEAFSLGYEEKDLIDIPGRTANA